MKKDTIAGLEIYTPKQRWKIIVAIITAFSLIAWILHTKTGPGDHLTMWIAYTLACVFLCWRLMTRNKKSPRR